MDLHMEVNDGLSFKVFPTIAVKIGVYFSRVCHWGPCRNLKFGQWVLEYFLKEDLPKLRFTKF